MNRESPYEVLQAANRELAFFFQFLAGVLRSNGFGNAGNAGNVGFIKSLQVKLSVDGSFIDSVTSVTSVTFPVRGP